MNTGRQKDLFLNIYSYIENYDMKEEIEVISNIYNVSFVCSFGYFIQDVVKAEDRMEDLYTFKHWDTFDVIRIKRKDFFAEMEDRYGGITIGERNLNACKDHDLFSEITAKGISRWTKSRIYRDIMDIN